MAKILLPPMRVRLATLTYPHDGTGRDPAEVWVCWPYGCDGVHMLDAKNVIVSRMPRPPRAFYPSEFIPEEPEDVRD